MFKHYVKWKNCNGLSHIFLISRNPNVVYIQMVILNLTNKVDSCKNMEIPKTEYLVTSPNVVFTAIALVINKNLQLKMLKHFQLKCTF